MKTYDGVVKILIAPPLLTTALKGLSGQLQASAAFLQVKQLPIFLVLELNGRRDGLNFMSMQSSHYTV
jgi:hypothetical protein